MSFEEKVLKKFEILDTTVQKVVQKLDALDASFQKSNLKLDALDAVVNTRILPKLLDLDAYVHQELATKGELRAAKNELVDHIDFLAQRSESHEQERLASTVRLDRIEKRVTKLERKAGEA